MRQRSADLPRPSGGSEGLNFLNCGGGAKACLSRLRTIPYLPLLRKFSHISSEAYGRRFGNPLLRQFFGEGELAQLSALAVVLSLAWQSRETR